MDPASARGRPRSQRTVPGFARIVGAFLIDTGARVALTVSVLVAAAWHALRPRTWRRTVRRELVRQCWQVGLSGLPATGVTALVVGLALVFQALYWLRVLGGVLELNEVILGTLVRELTPLLVAFIVIGRSVTVMIVELLELRASGQIRMLDAQGVDSFDYLVVPRIVAFAASTFSLGVIFVAVTMTSGYLVARGAGIAELPLIEFLAEVAGGLGIGDFVLLPLKTLLIGAVIAAIACVTVLDAPSVDRDAKSVLPRGYIRAVLATLVVSGSLTLVAVG